MRVLLVAARALFFAGCFFCLWGWLAWEVRRYDPSLGGQLPEGLALVGWALVALAVGFVLLAHGFVVLYEEPALVRAFGDSYADYKRSVGRWLPGWRAARGPG